MEVLRNLTEEYPNQPVSSHLAIALADFPHFDGISDKELFFVLEKYRCEKELDISTPLATDDEIDELLKGSIEFESDEFISDEEDF